MYLMCLSTDPKRREAFECARVATGRKLDMGEACIRFRTLDDLALNVLEEALRACSATEYIRPYEQ